MKKMPRVFKMDMENKALCLPEVNPGCEWVLAGEGIATRKWDGTACLVRDGKLYKRYDAKNGKKSPLGFEPAQDPDPITGHWPGWLEVSKDNPADKWHVAAQLRCSGPLWELKDGTYELCGPKIGANHDGLDGHYLIEHGTHTYDYNINTRPGGRSFIGLRNFLYDYPIEGLVFHHPDGRMAKVTRHNYGMEWPVNGI